MSEEKEERKKSGGCKRERSGQGTAEQEKEAVVSEAKDERSAAEVAAQRLERRKQKRVRKRAAKAALKEQAERLAAVQRGAVQSEEKEEQRNENEESEQQQQQQQKTKKKGSKRKLSAYEEVFGEGAKPSVKVKENYRLSNLTGRKSLRVKDVQDLFMWALGHASCPSAFQAQHIRLVKQVVVLVVSELNCISLARLMQKMTGAGFPSFSLENVASLQAPGSNLRAYSMGMELLLRREGGKSSKKSKKAKPAPCSAEQLLLTAEELQEHGFPVEESATGGIDQDVNEINDAQQEEGDEAKEEVLPLPAYVETPDVGDAPEMPQLLAMDCEMVMTTGGLELARVSIVNETEEVLLDCMVLPTNKITDYLTMYSGVTAELLNGVTTTLRDARDKVMALVPRSAILIGHSLENDLRCLRLVHRRVIDTSVCFPHSSGPPYKNSLRGLSQLHLQETIQQASHDSVVDAQATLRLVKLKMANGVDFAVQKRTSVSVWTLLDAGGGEGKSGALCVSVQNAGTLGRVRSQGLGTADVVISAEGDAGVANEMVSAHKAGGALVYGQLNDLYIHHSSNGEKLSEDDCAASIAACVSKVWGSLKPNTLFLLSGDRGNMKKANELRKDDSKQQELRDEIGVVRDSLIWVMVKE